MKCKLKRLQIYTKLYGSNINTTKDWLIKLVRKI